METLNELLKDKPLLPRLHWLPRFMDRVMSGACVAFVLVGIAIIFGGLFLAFTGGGQ